MGIKVTFLRDEEDAAPSARASSSTVLVPKTAVRPEGAQSVVFVVHGDTAERRAVKLGGADGDRLEVLAGLQSGEQVVLTVPPTLKDGARVAVK
jgi:HlyD family secretion protein